MSYWEVGRALQLGLGFLSFYFFNDSFLLWIKTKYGISSWMHLADLLKKWNSFLICFYYFYIVVCLVKNAVKMSLFSSKANYKE